MCVCARALGGEQHEVNATTVAVVMISVLHASCILDYVREGSMLAYSLVFV